MINNDSVFVSAPLHTFGCICFIDT